jgi:hypothetical protein
MRQDALRFDEVFCSSCGEGFGPGNHGFSHCEHHSYDAPRKQSYTQKILRVFQENENVWLDADVLASHGGKYAWRTRTSEARRIFERANLGHIENRQRKAREGYTISEYRYVPK